MNLTEFTQKFASQFEEGEDFEIQPDTEFRDLATWDSLTAMCVQTMVLDDYGVTMADHDFKKLSTVQEVFDFVVNAKN